jgi:arylsulfatase
MPKPNLLFVYTDEQRYDTMAAYGNTQIEMPNLNRLSEQSIVFDQAYVTQPVCTPSRSTLLTGQYPHTNGCTENNVSLRPDTLCLPEMIQDDEYVTAHYGKWHLGDEIFAQHGFQHWRGIDDGYRKYYSESRDRDARCEYHHWLIEKGHSPADGATTFGRGQAASLPEEFSKPAFLAEEAAKFIDENKDSPWVLHINFFEPHMPFFGPRDDQYDPQSIPLPENFDNIPGEDAHPKNHLFQRAYERNGHSGVPLKTTEDWRRLRARYWGLCSQVDTHFGKVLQALEASGVDENTIIVYTSDHGDMMGCHRLLAKCVMYEEATRVPFLLRVPGLEGRRINGPVSQIDIVPTLLDLMGQPVPDHLDGRSLKTEVETGCVQLEDDVIIEWNGPNNGFGDVTGKVCIDERLEGLTDADGFVAAVTDSIRTIVTPDGWKLNYSPGGWHELFNLKDDPFEKENRYKEFEGSDLIADLVARIRAWQERVNDEVVLP